MSTRDNASEGPDAPAATSLAARLAAAGLDWIVPDWPAPVDVGALSTTRRGGASAGAAAGMNLGLAGAMRSGVDTVETVMQNRRQLERFLPSPPVWLDQVHGADVAVLDAASAAAARERPPVADAAITRERDIVLAVLTADCLPVMFADRRGRAVGIAHAGWRGLARGVLAATVTALDALGAPAGGLCAWLGPAIGPRAFEVGEDVRNAFSAIDRGSMACFAPHGSGKWLADLGGLARQRLAAAGVRTIGGGAACTWSDATRFYSYRRDRATGRMATVIWLQPGDATAKL
jgi:polyphenol oxidase